MGACDCVWSHVHAFNGLAERSIPLGVVQVRRATTCMCIHEHMHVHGCMPILIGCGAGKKSHDAVMASLSAKEALDARHAFEVRSKK